MWRTASDGSICSSLNAAFCPIVSKYMQLNRHVYSDDGATERHYFKISVILEAFLKLSNYLNAYTEK